MKRHIQYRKVLSNGKLQNPTKKYTKHHSRSDMLYEIMIFVVEQVVFQGMGTMIHCHSKLSDVDIIYWCKASNLPGSNKTSFEPVVTAWRIEDVYKSRRVFLNYGDASLYFPSIELSDEAIYFCYTNYFASNCSEAYLSARHVKLKVYGM